MNSELRARLKNQASALLERTALKVDLAPLGVALDVDFLEHVLLFVSAVDAALSQDERSTIPPVDACGLCGHPRRKCGCQAGDDDPDAAWPADPIVPKIPDVIEGRVRE